VRQKHDSWTNILQPTKLTMPSSATMRSKPADAVDSDVQRQQQVKDTMIEVIMLQHLLTERAKRNSAAMGADRSQVEEKNRCATTVIGTLYDPPFPWLLKPKPVHQGGFQQRLLAPMQLSK